MRLLIGWLLCASAWGQFFPFPGPGNPAVAAGGANTFTLQSQQTVTTGCGSVTTCSPAFTITAGRLGVIWYANSGGTVTLSSVTGGGTWTVNASCNAGNGNGGLSCAYITPGTTTSTASAVTLNFSGTTTSSTVFYWEYTFTGASFALDAINAAVATPGACTLASPNLTLTGTNSVLIAAAAGVSLTGVNSPYANYAANGTQGAADHANTASGTGATFTCSAQFGGAPAGTVAFK